MTKEESCAWFKEASNWSIALQRVKDGEGFIWEDIYQAFKARMIAEIRDAEEKEEK